MKESFHLSDNIPPAAVLEGSTNNTPHVIYHSVLRSPYQFIFTKMTPYVVHEENNKEDLAEVPQKPKSIMVGSTNGFGNGTLKNGSAKSNGCVKNGAAVNGHHHHPAPEEEDAETPDSLPSRSSVSGRSIIGNGKNGRSGALKRVSFGSSKGSMVETLVYDHQEDLMAEVPPAYLAAPHDTNGDESRVHPAKVRVKFIESQSVAQVTPPSPDVTIDFESMTSPGSEHSPEYHRQISHESGIDNPFRPDGELSREADTIVSLIQQGKPITPVKGEELLDMEGVVLNGIGHDSTDNGDVIVKKEMASESFAPSKGGANGKAPKSPGVVEVQRGVIVPPTDAPAVEQVVIKKKKKCCVIQ